MLRDPDLPLAEVLLGEGATRVLDRAGGRVVEATPEVIDYRPGRRLAVTYDAVVELSDGSRTEEVLGAAVDGDGEHVWRHPDDPALPGLRAANDPAWVGALVADLGLARGEVELEELSYSARSRAVVEVSAAPAGGKLVFRPGAGLAAPEPEPVLYLKVLRPERARELLAAHDALEPLLPVPRCVAHVDDLGILALAPLPGVPLWDCVVEGTHRPLDGAELVAVLDRIRDAPVDRAARRPPTEAFRRNAEMLHAVVPEEADRLARFAERLGEDAPQEQITIHGDFHEVQVLVDDGGLAGVLDLDDVGRGARVDDLAMLAGRLWAYAQSEPENRARLVPYVDGLLRAWESQADPAELRRRVAAVAMNHATLPFRYQYPDWRRETVAAIAAADALL